MSVEGKGGCERLSLHECEAHRIDQREVLIAETVQPFVQGIPHEGCRSVDPGKGGIAQEVGRYTPCDGGSSTMK